MKDFIGIYPNSIPNELCDELVNIVGRSSIKKDRPENYASEPHRQDMQIVLESFFPGMAGQFMNFVGNSLLEYLNDECPFLKQYTFISSATLLQKTEPIQGYHSFHCENTAWDLNCRSMAWMVYLNDVEDGGETEFLYQQKKIKPERGTVVIWPGGYTHMHRGNPPMGDKYIATGWYQLDQGSLDSHVLRPNDNKNILST